MPRIKVFSEVSGHRCAGIHFGIHGVELDTKHLSRRELDAIHADPMLEVIEITDENRAAIERKEFRIAAHDARRHQEKPE